MLQWLVIIGASYLSLFNGTEISNDPRVLLLVAALMSSGLVLQRLPQQFFPSVKLNYLLVFVDIVLILVGIALKRESPWELFLLFFLCLYIAGIGDNLIKALPLLIVLPVYLCEFIRAKGRMADPRNSSAYSVSVRRIDALRLSCAPSQKGKAKSRRSGARRNRQTAAGFRTGA